MGLRFLHDDIRNMYSGNICYTGKYEVVFRTENQFPEFCRVFHWIFRTARV